VVILDDVLATGGTAGAVAQLVAQGGGQLAGFGFLLELGFLSGREKLPADSVVESLRIL
jgi:adenine phosphoribosyltransferase